MAAIPKKMKALLLTGIETFELREIDTPEPGPGEVLAKVEAVAICGTDPKIVKGAFKGLWPKSYPAIIGHEWAGTIVKVGSETFGFSVGDRVAGEPHKGCGYCRNCMTGRYNICENYGNLESGHRHYGFTAPGAYANILRVQVEQFIIFPINFLLKKPPMSIQQPQPFMGSKGEGLFLEIV